MANASSATDHRHIAVLAFPFGTHASPLLTLTRRLSAADPTLIFSFLSTSSSNSSSFSSNKNPNIVPFNVPGGSPEELSFDIHVAVGRFLAVAEEGFREGMERAERERGLKISCLLTDAFLWFGAELAAEKEAAWVPYWTGGGGAMSAHVNTDLIRSTLGQKGTLTRADKKLDFIPGLSAIDVVHLQEGILHGDLESPMSLLLHKMGQYLPKATAVALNSFEELEPETTKDLKSKLRKVLCVGPSTLSTSSNANSDVNGCLSWLDKHTTSSSVVYISFGTITTPTPNELQALAETLKAKKIPFLWSIRDHSLGLLPEGFLEETKDLGKLVSWAPQVQVLAHPSIGVFVTHCGWNSISESITCGVPMICRPFFGDQNMNSQMVQDVWKIGIRVEGVLFSEVGMMKALEVVLFNEKGKEMRGNIAVLEEKARDAVGTNGTSTTNFRLLLEILKNGKIPQE